MSSGLPGVALIVSRRSSSCLSSPSQKCSNLKKKKKSQTCNDAAPVGILKCPRLPASSENGKKVNSEQCYRVRSAIAQLLRLNDVMEFTQSSRQLFFARANSAQRRQQERARRCWFKKFAKLRAKKKK